MQSSRYHFMEVLINQKKVLDTAVTTECQQLSGRNRGGSIWRRKDRWNLSEINTRTVLKKLN